MSYARVAVNQRNYSYPKFIQLLLMSILKYFQSVSQTDTSDSVQDLSPTSTSTESPESAGQGDDSQGGRSECTSPSPKKSRTDSVSNSHDLARYIGRPMCLSDAEKYELLTNPSDLEPITSSQKVQLGVL